MLKFQLGAAALALGLAGTAWAGFAGQTILGPLSPGSVVMGDTTGATDDNDGFTSGDHFFFIWNGPDDVWQLDWPGGDLALEMTYDPLFGDLDLFLYEPGSLDDSATYSILNTGVESLAVPGAVAGTYYIVIDGAGTDSGPYSLMVLPAPGALALFGFAGALGAGRLRRRA